MNNCDPQLVGRRYMEYLLEIKIILSILQIDQGSETGTMATIHAYLKRRNTDNVKPEDAVQYGPSTSNQVWNQAIVQVVIV